MLSLLLACSQDDPAKDGTSWVDPPFPTAPDADGDGFGTEIDCDDADASVFPGAPDLCGDDLRTDCNRLGDGGLITVDGVETFEDLASALASASPGSEVRICGYVYGEVTAPVPTRLVGHPPYAVIEGEWGGTVLVVPPGTELVDLTIQHGQSDTGGGLRLSGTGELVLRGTTVISNQARQGGGIALTEGSTLRLLEGSSVQGSAEEGGGGVLAPPGSTVELDATSEIEGSAAFGGGVWLDGATLRGGTVDGTTSSDLTLEVVEGVLQGEGPLGGGGVLATGEVLLQDTVVTGWSYAGGGISAWRSALTLQNVQVVEAHADVYGGGLLVAGGQATLDLDTEIVGYANYGGCAAVIDGTLSGGTLSGGFVYGSGGALMIENGVVEDVAVREAEGNGGAVYVQLRGELTDVVIEDNGMTALEASWYSPFDPQASAGTLSLTRVVMARNGHASYESSSGGGLVTSLEVVATDSVLEENFVAWGASAVMASAPVRWEGGSITGHTHEGPGPDNSAVVVYGLGSWVATGVDLGTGPTENMNVDVLTYDEDNFAQAYDYQGIVSVSCTAQGCE